MESLLKKALNELLRKFPLMNPHIETTAKHLAQVALYDLSGLNALQPPVREKCTLLMNRMRALGKPIILTQGYRPAALQDTYYAKGRDAAGNEVGKTVTDARGLESYHQYGLAADFWFEGYNYTNNQPPEAYWDILGAEGKALGLEWGGDWKGFRDRPHFEYHPGYTWKDLIAFFKK